MTRKSRREIKRAIEALTPTGPAEIEIESTVVTVTEDMTDETGDLVEEIEPPKEGAEILPTESDVVTVWSWGMD